MKMNIFGREANFDQLALATQFPHQLMGMLPGVWSQDEVSSEVNLLGFHEIQNITFRLFYNYEQDIPFKELELIQFMSYHNFHSFSNHAISPLGLYAPSLYDRFKYSGKLRPFISHIGIHCSEKEGEDWRAHFKSYGIDVAHEDWSYAHTNPVIAGKRKYHNIIFASRRALGFDFKACIRVNINGT